MASTTEDAEAAVELLEAALERIARLSALRQAPAPNSGQPDSGLPIEEVRERLDRMIERLRAALDAEA